MSLQHAAKHLASHGRGPDTELVHMTKGEINSLQTLAKANGGSLTINPHTGLAEAGFLSKLLPMAIGAGLAYATGGTSLAATGGLFGMGMPATIGMGMGALQTARTGSLQKGLMAGLGAYGGAGLAGGLMGAGAAGAQTAANQAVAASPEFASLNATSSLPGAFGEAAGSATPQFASESARQAALSGAQQTLASPFSSTMAGAQGLTEKAGRDAFMQQMGGGSGLFKTGLAATAPMLMGGEQQPQTPIGDSTMPQRLVFESGVASPYPAADSFDYNNPGRDFGRQRSYFPNAGYRQISQEEAKKLRGYAGGGPVEAMSNANAIGANTGFPMANINKPSYATPFQTPISQNVVQGSADADVNSMTGEMNEFAEGGITGSGNLDLSIPLNFGGGASGQGGGQGVFGGGPTAFGSGANGYQAAGSGNVFGGGQGQKNNLGITQPFGGQNVFSQGFEQQRPLPADPFANDDNFNNYRNQMQGMVKDLESSDQYKNMMSLNDTMRNYQQQRMSTMSPGMGGGVGPGDNPRRSMRSDAEYRAMGLDPELMRMNPGLYGGPPQKPSYDQYAAENDRRLAEKRQVGSVASMTHDYVGPTMSREEFDVFQNTPKNPAAAMAAGGLSAAYAAGGMSHLGDYSDGGRLLKGPGDGVSDSIPATIGNKQPARLADGEFVVPARIVSELGNGSTEAGARKLYAMLDRVQQARGKTVGKGKVAKNTRADKLLPA